MRCATCRTSPTSWSIPKARWSGATTGRRPRTRSWSAPSCMCSTPKPTRRSRGVATFLSDPARPFERTLARDDDDQSSRHGGRAARPSGRRFGRARGAEQERERALGRALHRDVASWAFIAIPSSPRSPRRCDWRIADLIDADHPVSLYLVVPPSDISRTKPLIRLVLNQIGRRLTETLGAMQSTTPRRQLLLMLDEFPALGRLDFFESASRSWRATACAPS